MTDQKRQMHFGVFQIATGSHIAGWRMPGAIDNAADIESMVAIALEAERGLFDFIFNGDNVNCDPKAHPSYASKLEPITMLAAVAMRTTHIGLGATSSTTYGDPFTTARMFASVDHISGGRAGWNAVTTSNPQAAANFGMEHPDHARRYERATEFCHVVKELWNCWDEDAAPRNRETGQYFDTDKIRTLDHEGTFFKVKGPINIPRSPQGRPVIIQAGGSEPGQILAAEFADVVFTVTQDMEESKRFYDSLKGRLAQFGRRPDQLVILPGVMPVVGKTEAEAREKLAQLMSFVDDATALGMLSERFNTDMSGYDLDGPVPDLGQNDAYHAFSSAMLNKARRENLKLRDLYNIVAAARGHWVLCGSAEQVADTLQEWFEAGAADGFNVMPGWFTGGLSDFVDLVIPILQERGLYRTEYPGKTLRENLGVGPAEW